MKLGFPVVSTTISRALNNQNESVGTNMVPVEHHKEHDAINSLLYLGRNHFELFALLETFN